MMTYFISRHPGALAWAKRKGLHIDRILSHLDPTIVQKGDTVLGTLPIPLVATVCARGARYYHLTVDLPATLRGQELSANELEMLQAELVEYQAIRIDHKDQNI